MISKLSTISLLVLMGLFISTTSCKKDSGVNCGGLGYAFAILDETEAWSTAYNAYIADPEDKAKCEAYVAAYTDYLDALRDYDNCVTGAERDDWQDSIDEAIEDIESTDCD